MIKQKWRRDLAYMDQDNYTKASNLSEEEAWLCLFFLCVDIEYKNYELWDQFRRELIFHNRFHSDHPIVEELQKRKEEATQVIKAGSLFYRARKYNSEDYRKKVVDYITKIPATKDKYTSTLFREKKKRRVVPIKDDLGNVTGLVSVMLEMRHLNQYRFTYLKAVAVETAGLALLTAVIAFFYTKRRYIRPIKKIIKETHRFAAENTKTAGVGDVGSINEFVELAHSVDSMEVDIFNYIDNITHITAEKERADAELGVAKTIQTNAVPNSFPAFPERTDFDIFASMTSAKEVGGDFYNFFLIDDDHLAIMIGDVSGKGVPAALFMMQTNILLTEKAHSGGTPAEILRDVNDIVCQQNNASMFVTVWLGIIELSTGKITAASAGHDDPAVYRRGGVFELIGAEHGLFIGAFEGVEYENFEIRLGEGDKVFIYTDGVHEAVNADEEMFTVDRMLRSLNEVGTQSPECILEHVKSSVAAFVGDVSQFDDLTMLCFELKTSGSSKQTLCVDAKLNNYADVIAFIDKLLEQNGCDEENRLRVQLAVDEIFTNIVNYAYGAEGGKVEIAFLCKDGIAEITFADNGIPYDPLKKDDPDITLSPEEMQIGGLGVFIAKNNMDAISYRYENNRNILTMSKNVRNNDSEQ